MYMSIFIFYQLFIFINLTLTQSFSKINPIFNNWNCIGIVNNIDFTKPYTFNIGDLPLVLWKNKENYDKNEDEYITSLNICPHMGSSLNDAIVLNSGCIKCTYHGYSLNYNDKIGKCIVFQNKLFWTYNQDTNILPLNIPHFNDENYCKQFFYKDFNCDLIDSSLNAMDIYHPEFVHNNFGFGNNKLPFDIIHNYNDNKIFEISFKYYTNKLIQSINGNIEFTQNLHVFNYPSSTYSIVSFDDTNTKQTNNLIIAVNFLPIENKKTRWFLTILHNYKKSPIDIKFMNFIANVILSQDFQQLNKQFLDIPLKRLRMFNYKFENEDTIIKLYNCFNEYKYPNIDDATELYKDYLFQKKINKNI